MDRFVVKGSKLPLVPKSHNFEVKKIDEAIPPRAPPKRSGNFTILNRQVKKMKFDSGLSAYGRSRTCHEMQLTASSTVLAPVIPPVELSDDEEHSKNESNNEIGSDTELLNEEDMNHDEPFFSSELFTGSSLEITNESKSTTLDRLEALRASRQVSLDNYSRRTERRRVRSSKSVSRHYSPYEEHLIQQASKGNLIQFGRPSHLTITKFSNLHSLRLGFVSSVFCPSALMGPISDVSCSHIKFDSQGILFAVGHSNGVVAVFDMDECLNTLQKSAQRDEVEILPKPPKPSPVKIAPVVILQIEKKSGITEIVWLPRCARPRRSKRVDIEEDECILAVSYNSSPFVHLYDISSPTIKPMVVLEHGDGRINGGGNESLLYISNCEISDRTSPARHQVIAGSRHGHIRMWRLGQPARPVWTVIADPHGALNHIGSVVSLHCIYVRDVNDVRDRSKVAGRIDSSEFQDPYLDNAACVNETGLSCVLLSTTSSGILCYWDMSEKNCRRNVPAFGVSSSYEPLLLRRFDLLKLLGTDENDKVASAAYDAGSHLPTGSKCYVEKVVGASVVVFKFQSGSLLSLDVFTGDVVFRSLSREGGFYSEHCGSIQLLSKHCCPSKTLVVVDTLCGTSMRLRSFHPYSDTISHSAPPSALPFAFNSALNIYTSSSTEVSSDITIVQKKESSNDGHSSVETAPCFTVPGQIWSIKRKLNEAKPEDVDNFTTIIEYSENLTPYIGFSAEKSKHVWLQMEAGYSSKKKSSAGFLDYLLGKPATDIIGEDEICSERRYSVRSILSNSIELYEPYTGPEVEDGYPVIQLRTDKAPLSFESWMHSKSVDITSSNAQNPFRLDATHLKTMCTKELPAYSQQSVTKFCSHPSLPYVLCGFRNGNVFIMSSDLL